MAEHQLGGVLSDAHKLTGVHNYAMWKIRMEQILKRDECYWLINSEWPKLCREDDIVSARLKNKALTSITLSCVDSIMRTCSKINCPKQLWDYLSATYQVQNNAQRLHLKKKLQNLSMTEDTSVTEFVAQLTDLALQIAELPDEENVRDADLVEILLNALPDSYEGLLNSINGEATLPTFDNIVARLLQHENRRKLRLDKTIGEERTLALTHELNALRFKGGGFSRSNPPHRVQPHASGRVGPCNFCGEYGHLMRNCSELAKEIARRAKERQAQRNRYRPVAHLVNASTSSEEHTMPMTEDDIEVAVDLYEATLGIDSSSRPSAIEPSSNVNSLSMVHPDLNSVVMEKPWYLDSGASKHVTGDKSTLAQFDSRVIDVTPLKSAGGSGHPVYGKGNLLFDTSEGEIKIPGVLYVPSISTNLLSVGCITDSKHHLVTFDDRQCLIIEKPSNTVVARGIRDSSNGLYKLVTGPSSSLKRPFQLL